MEKYLIGGRARLTMHYFKRRTLGDPPQIRRWPQTPKVYSRCSRGLLSSNEKK